ncbi:C-C motif chemokine 18-like isoform X1 [Ovis canadensis]
MSVGLPQKIQPSQGHLEREDSSHPRRRQAEVSSQASSQLCPQSSACLSSIMKVLVAAVFVLCAVALCSCAQKKVYTPPTCCFTYASGKIPQGNVVNYFKTSSDCPKPGIIFLTRKGRYVCVNPADSWVQKYIRDLKKSP